MTITRIGQLTGETRVLTGIVFTGNEPSLVSSPVRTGGYSYRASGLTYPWGFTFPAVSAIRLGYWFRTSGLPAAPGALLYRTGASLANALNNNDRWLAIQFNVEASEIYIYRPDSENPGNSVRLATAPAPQELQTTNAWFHIGVTHKISDSNGFISLYIDGRQVLNYIGDTRPARSALSYPVGNPAYDTVLTSALLAGRSTSGGTYYNYGYLDDIFLDSYEGEADAPVPARRFLMALPDGAGADADWTPEGGATNYQNVDDNPHDFDTTYNKAVAPGLRDTFTFSDITVPDDHRIVAVLPTPLVKRLDAEIDMQLSLHAWDGSQYGDSPDLTLPMSYGSTPVFHRFTTQPDGSGWTEVDFNAMQFGYRSRGTFL